MGSLTALIETTASYQLLIGACAVTCTRRCFASSRAASHSGLVCSVVAWPSTYTECFARVIDTFMRRASLRKPMPRACSRERSERTAERRITWVRPRARATVLAREASGAHPESGA